MFLLLFSTSITIQIHLYFDMNLNSLQQTIYTDVMYDVYFVFIEFQKMFTTRIICTYMYYWFSSYRYYYSVYITSQKKIDET